MHLNILIWETQTLLKLCLTVVFSFTRVLNNSLKIQAWSSDPLQYSQILYKYNTIQYYNIYIIMLININTTPKTACEILDVSDEHLSKG